MGFSDKIRRPSEAAEVVDLDVTPVMNMFVILIPFLVSMAVFTHYSMLEFSLPPSAGVDSGGPSKKDLRMTVVLRQDSVLCTVGDSVWAALPAVQAEDSLTSVLKDLRPQLNRQADLVLSVQDPIRLDRIVDVMDWSRRGGFSKIALAEGPPVDSTQVLGGADAVTK
jgi:biopolymer transport protein ExbD